MPITKEEFKRRINCLIEWECRICGELWAWCSHAKPPMKSEEEDAK